MYRVSEPSEIHGNAPASPAPANHSSLRRRNSFFLHLRPESYPPAALSFFTTWHLGFLSVFFLVLEVVSGIVLMIYYVPTPEGAYGSIVRLQSEIWFGGLMRDLHRLGGEGMVAVVAAHLVRVFLAGAYEGRRRRTWVTGVALLLCTLLLAFSGYLLPWDQLAFWAVTIGTSMVETIPVTGAHLTLLLRGGAEFSADGLLRFYFLHVIILPVIMSAALAVHYYRVSRLHSVTVPGSGNTSGSRSRDTRPARIPLLPHVALVEAMVSILLLCLLILIVSLWYDAPLQHHADPRHTPTATRAPWFFLWLQGALKLGDGFLMGVFLPAGLLLFLFVLPYLGPVARFMRRRASALLITAVAIVVIVLLSYRGLPLARNVGNDATVLLERMIPEESKSRFHTIAFDRLVQGIYQTRMTDETGIPGDLGAVVHELRDEVESLAANADYIDPQGLVIIEEWQADLKRITLRLHWQDGVTKQPTAMERVIFRHRLSGRDK